MKAGLFPFSLDRVLKDIQWPPAQLTVPKANNVVAGSPLQDGLLQTPVTAEGLTSLRSHIEEEVHTLDETSRKRLQKLANAVRVSFAECALL
ncbi:hypothetical protein BCR34DRAFT_643422 [Clohesyomyces aquaticus]|uniref:Uncharacterized protein n=1 Tax=Clohesyomyces aquaticus TaxID=1231657 RepID=A0A1Y1ZYA6_9PLEO|nr:hypothetical protein BCR34DRAFT_643422 [Clohesyomyces aquaticus]